MGSDAENIGVIERGLKRGCPYQESIESGAAKLTPLELDTYGNFLSWPKDFFGDPMGDIAAMQSAVMKRKGIAEE